MPLLDQVKQMKIEDGRDPMFEDAVRVVREAGRGSISLIQREIAGWLRTSRTHRGATGRSADPDPIRAVRKDARCSIMVPTVSAMASRVLLAVAAAARMMPLSRGFGFEI